MTKPFWCAAPIPEAVVLALFFLVSVTVGENLLYAQGAESTPQTSMEKGRLQYQQGKLDEAVLSWIQASRGYEEAGDHPNHVQALIAVSRALVELGHNRRAETLLHTAIKIAQTRSLPRLEAQALSQLGALHLNLGEPESAGQILQQGLKVARDIEDRPLMAALLNDLGNAHTAGQNPTEALAAYTESRILADSLGLKSLATRANINTALVEISQLSAENAKLHLSEAMEMTQTLPASHEQVQNFLTIGMGWRDLHSLIPDEASTTFNQSAGAFREAIARAQTLEAWKDESYGWGFLAELYEETGQNEESLKLNQLAIRASQKGQAPEALYRWQWKTGRVLKNLGRMNEAINAYQQAVDTLQPIRQELVSGLAHQPNAFRESLGALFFEMADTLLKQADRSEDASRREALLYQTRDTIEAFKAAELQDYFKDDCVEVNQARIQAIDQISPGTAIIYPVLFPDRMDLLVSLGGTIKKVTVPVRETELSDKIRRLRAFLEKRTTHQYLPHAQELYNLLIRPLEPLFKEFTVHTLVFVPDGSLRTIPMAALHNGERFLIQQYAIATTPGLTLTDAHPLDRDQVHLLSIGLTEGVQGFSPLPNVREEIQTLHQLFGGKTLLDEEFLVPQVEQEMKEENFTVVHIASHGKFEQNVKDSFVLTFDQKLTMDHLGDLIGLFQFRKTPLDLITFSACETAAGDDRAALGLAGVAVKAGARSALATLWFINDQATSDLVNQFYVRLKKSSLTKAQALREAQLALLDHPIYRHPSYWASFLLINNWL